MNPWMVKTNAFSSFEEMRGSAFLPDLKESIVCPKPRRLGISSPSFTGPIRSLRCHVSHQVEQCDSITGKELLDIILTKSSYNSDNFLSSSPPFFLGSPPTRSVNPLARDSVFGQLKIDPLYPLLSHPVPTDSIPSPSTPALTRQGCAPTKSTFNSAPIKVEGFDCHNHDRGRRTHGITAVA